MTVQTVPYALQNASHSAALFRQSASAPFLVGGALSSLELLVTQQGSPNMSVILGPGRAKVTGTSVSPPAGQSWTTQAMYDCLNDAGLTLTVAASNPTNPRIDLVYIQVQDSFYSGAANQAIAGVVTGTPAASPAVPATPANAVAIATIAVGAGVTSIVNANIARVVASAVLIGGLYPTLTPTTLAALQTAATLPAPASVAVLSNGSEWYWNGTIMTLDNVPRVASSAARDALYVAPVAVANGDTVYRTDTKMMQTYDGTRWRYTQPGLVPIIPTSVVNGTISASGGVSFSAVTSLSVNGVFTTEFDNYVLKLVWTARTGAVQDFLGRLRLAGTDNSAASSYGNEAIFSSGAGIARFASQTTSWLLSPGPTGTFETGEATINLFSPALAAATRFDTFGTNEIAALTGTVLSLCGGSHNVTTAFDGFSIFGGAAGAYTGTLHIYGYNN